MKKIHNIILLCSEITRGMKSYGPKSFVPVSKHKIPFIIYQIQQIISTHGKNTSIYIVVGFEQEKFIKLIETEFPRRKYKHINIIYNEKYHTTNNAYSAGLAISQISQGNTLIFNNGIWSNFKPANNSKPSLPIVKTSKDTFDIGITVESQKAYYLCYGLKQKWSEIIYFDAHSIGRIKNTLPDYNLRSKFLFEFINNLIDDNFMFDIDTISPRQILKVLNHKQKI